MDLKSKRMGELIEKDGVVAFKPRSLSDIEEPNLSDGIQVLLSEADISVGRLDALSDMLPNPDLFVMMYIKKEAVWSSQIEGTQASLMDVLEFEAESLRPDAPRDVEEVANYIKAVHRGVELIGDGKDLDLKMIKDLHFILMKDTRGGTFAPGEFRKVQNWIGSPGSGINDAFFIPPDPDTMKRSMKDLASFLKEDKTNPPLIKAALAHVQFETIHPFIDGNGRMGRLLIILSLIKDGHLRSPLLYISHYLRQMRSDYYEKLQKVRMEGDLEGWIRFFLVGVSLVAEEASERARRILELSRRIKEKVLKDLGRNGPKASILVEELLMRPVVGVKEISEITGLSYQNANKLASKLESIKVLKEVTGHKRNRVYEFEEYLDLLND